MKAEKSGERRDGAVLELEIGGARLPLVVRGEGPTVVFLHGALTDLRMWDRHAATISDRYRAVCYTQRYFGTAPWGSDWPPFGVHTHSADLVQLLVALGGGPVHLVAWSYAGHAALDVAVRRPDLVESLFIYEPGAPTYVSDPAELAELAADANAMFGPIFEAVQVHGDDALAVRRLLDGSGQAPGYFDAQPPDRRDMQMDNARTMPLLLSQPAPPAITCAQLGRLSMPVCIAHGERTRPVFGVPSRAAARCIPHGRHLVVPGATHMWPDESPEAFTAAVVDFLESAAARATARSAPSAEAPACGRGGCPRGRPGDRAPRPR